MQRLRWEFERALRGVGVAGWAALALIGTALLAALFLTGGLADDARGLERDNLALQRQLRDRGNVPVQVSTTPEQQLADFERRFGDEKSITASWARLHALAQRHGVRLEQGEFKLASETREPLARYAILLPVKTDYRALRRFMRAAMKELPGLALEEVSLRRGDANVSGVDAQLRFVLFINKSVSGSIGSSAANGTAKGD
jgi:hypothetical protein